MMSESYVIDAIGGRVSVIVDMVFKDNILHSNEQNLTSINLIVSKIHQLL